MSSAEGILEQIKAGPHWRVVIRPMPYVEERLQLEDCLPAVARATVRFRGWDFPHFNRNMPPEMRTNFAGSAESFHGHLEYWRVYQSGQFAYLSSVREWSESAWSAKLRQAASHRIVAVDEDFDWAAVPGFIEVVNFVYTITEFFEFAARFCQALAETEAVEITISLHGIQGFVLIVDDVRRGWWEYYSSDETSLERTWQIPLVDLLSSSTELALEAIRWFLVRFHWTEPNVESIKRDQEAL